MDWCAGAARANRSLRLSQCNEPRHLRELARDTTHEAIEADIAAMRGYGDGVWSDMSASPMTGGGRRHDSERRAARTEK